MTTKALIVSTIVFATLFVGIQGQQVQTEGKIETTKVADVKERETMTYLKITQEMGFNFWSGFLEGFYARDAYLKRNKCMGDTTLQLLY